MKKIVLATIILATALLYGEANAAVIYFETRPLDEGFTTTLTVDTENEEINALEGIVSVSSNLQNLSAQNGNSVIPMWIEKPEYQNSKIKFSGIIPGGFNGKGKLFEIQHPENLANFFELTSVRIFLNNPNGELATTTSHAIVYQKQKSEMADIYPPERFKPEIVSEQGIENGKYVLVFSTTDKGSGIDKYQIMEKGAEENSNWEDAESPYLIKDQSLESDIYVRAVDKSGNFLVSYLPAQNKPSNAQKLLWLIPLLLLLLISGLFAHKKYAKK